MPVESVLLLVAIAVMLQYHLQGEESAGRDLMK